MAAAGRRSVSAGLAVSQMIRVALPPWALTGLRRSGSIDSGSTVGSNTETTWASAGAATRERQRPEGDKPCPIDELSWGQ